MAEQRKATDASGKGIEEEGAGRNYKPKMPGNKRPGGVGAASRSGAEGASSASKPAGGKIPKWKLQSM